MIASNKSVNQIARLLLGASAFFSILITLAIIYVLGSESLSFFKEVSVFDFLFGTRWEPLLEPKSFGVLPLVSGTMIVVLFSGILAIPTGLMTAIYLSEYALPKTRNILKPVLEILSGIPTIVYGHFALTFVTPILQKIFPNTEVFNALSASIVVAIMILPMVTSLCDDAIKGVPDSLKFGGYALGATSTEVVFGIVLPASFSRIIAAFILAISRAMGETMAVTLAAGASPVLATNPLGSIQTMTAYIVQISLGDTPAGGIEYLTSFAVAALLFLMTLMMNIVGHRLMRRYQERG